MERAGELGDAVSNYNVKRYLKETMAREWQRPSFIAIRWTDR
jgi:hypothetical protein